jgi:hypothetical protein
MSPDNSDTRTLLYKDKNGVWTTIGLEEARRFESFAPNEGEPLKPLFTALETVQKDEPNYEQAQALKRWWQMWLDDRDWQKVINHGMTTTEVKFLFLILLYSEYVYLMRSLYDYQ